MKPLANGEDHRQLSVKCTSFLRGSLTQVPVAFGQQAGSRAKSKPFKKNRNIEIYNPHEAQARTTSKPCSWQWVPLVRCSVAIWPNNSVKVS